MPPVIYCDAFPFVYLYVLVLLLGSFLHCWETKQFDNEKTEKNKKQTNKKKNKGKNKTEIKNQMEIKNQQITEK